MIDRVTIGDEANLIRPFTLTRGRTGSGAVPVPVEAVVRQSPASRSTPPLLGPVEADIWTAAGPPASPAEISARLGLALGVVQVLIGDLVRAGLVELTPARTSPTSVRE
jgi:peroxiredoxin Q/BCP